MVHSSATSLSSGCHSPGIVPGAEDKSASGVDAALPSQSTRSAEAQPATWPTETLCPRAAGGRWGPPWHLNPSGCLLMNRQSPGGCPVTGGGRVPGTCALALHSCLGNPGCSASARGSAGLLTSSVDKTLSFAQQVVKQGCPDIRCQVHPPVRGDSEEHTSGEDTSGIHSPWRWSPEHLSQSPFELYFPSN